MTSNPANTAAPWRTTVAVFLALLAGSAGAQPFETSKLVFYVSPRGNDHWSGKLPAADARQQDGPFATLPAARDAIRRLRRENRLAGPVDVMLLEGTYHLAEPFVLAAQDTGAAKQPIAYRAYPGHRPVLSGGRVVDEWKPFRGKIVESRLRRNDGLGGPSYGGDGLGGRPCFRQLFFRGQRQARARWPNPDPADPLYNGWAFIEPTTATAKGEPQTHRYAAEQPARQWARPELAEVHVFPWYCWVNDLLPLKKSDVAGRTITLARPPHFDFMTILPGNRFRVENVLEELDQPGEWCLRTDTGALYFWPPEELRPGDVIVPVIDSLVELRGTAESPLKHITISGLTFSHTRSPFPDDLHPNFHSPTRRGAGVTLEHCDGCRIEANRFVMLGGDGVRLQGPNARNAIVGNEIGHVGGAGVALASLDKDGNAGDTKDFADPAVLRRHCRRYPKLVRNVVSDNEIHHCGRIKKNCGGVQMYGIISVDNVISHNHVHHMSDKAVVMQDGFGRYVVEYNDMHDLGLEIADTGGIMVNRWFVLDDDPELSQGAIIRFNRIRNCVGCGAYAEARHPKGEGDRTTAGGRIWTPYYTWGIYFDNSGRKNTVFGNIVISTVLGGVSLPVGEPRDNVVENNIFIGSSGNQVDLRMDGQNNRFVRNIVYYADPQAMLLAAGSTTKKAVAECDYNVYFLAASQEPRIRGVGSLSEWKKLGFDRHSVVVDPRFVNADNGDYRLRPESPALSLGFQPIPMDKIGPRRGVVPRKAAGAAESTRGNTR